MQPQRQSKRVIKRPRRLIDELFEDGAIQALLLEDVPPGELYAALQDDVDGDVDMRCDGDEAESEGGDTNLSFVQTETDVDSDDEYVQEDEESGEDSLGLGDHERHKAALAAQTLRSQRRGI